MNNMSLTIVTILHYNVIVRDCLEYVLNKPTYVKAGYEMKKEGLMIEIEKPTALKQFMTANKEMGKKIEDEIKAAYAAIFADDNTICKIANNELRVDNSQHLAIYDVILPLHEDVRKAIDGHMGFARSKNLLEEELVKLAVADERMYRFLVLHCLYRDLESLFVEYNKARNEAHGDITPQSNFVQGELNRIGEHIFFIRDNLGATDNEIWDTVDYVIKTVECTRGRRQLPVGKNFPELFADGRKMLFDNLKKAEDTWKPLYDAAVAQVLEESKKHAGQIKIEVNNKEAK